MYGRWLRRRLLTAGRQLLVHGAVGAHEYPSMTRGYPPGALGNRAIQSDPAEDRNLLVLRCCAAWQCVRY